MSRKQKHELIRIICCLAAFLVLLVTDKALDGGLAGAVGGKYGWLLPFALYLAVYIAIGYDVLWRALRGILHGQMLDENFLMCIATLGAFALAIYTGASGQAPEGFDEGCAVLIFYQVGEFFQDYATGRSRRSISELMDIRPDSAHVIRGGETLTVDPSEVQPGEVISVAPGEKIPLDGVIVKGATSLDTRALTGESLPREAAEGDSVVSGSVNMTSSVEIRVEKAFHDSTVAKILDLVENAAEQKSKAENFITKFARWYTPIVVAAALLLAVIPGAVTGDWEEWVYRALSFLVVSCPCALVISVPLSFFAGIGAASKLGILIKGSNYLEKFDKADIFVFDKTGTLTKGNFAVVKVSPESERERILALAAAAERGSTHPIARSVTEAYGGETEGGYTLTDHAGEGVEAKKEGSVILVGNEKLMRRAGIAFTREDGAGTVLYVAHNGAFVGSMLVADEVKPETAAVIGDLNAMGCRTVMLTGDNERIAANVAEKVGVTDFKSSLLPQDKVEEVERELDAKKPKDVLCFVGDGINAPVLMRSDIGIAMGGVGSDAAIEASDIVLMRDDLTGIPVAKRVARKTMCVVYENIIFSIIVKIAILILSAPVAKRVARKTMCVVYENIIFSIIVKVAILILSAIGIAGMWLAVFGDVGVAVIAILNAMRVGSRRSVTAMKMGKTRILSR